MPITCRNPGHRSPPDSRLLERAREGHPDAVAELRRPFWEPVYRIAYRITGHRDDAEDLRQEALTRVLRSLPSFRSDCSFSTWVYRITWNVCSTASTRRPRPAEDWETRSDADPAPGPEETILRRDLLHRIGDAIHDLPDNYREAILLKVVAELPYEEVAELLDVSVGTARTRVYRGMARLRERLQSQMDEEAL